MLYLDSRRRFVTCLRSSLLSELGSGVLYWAGLGGDRFCVTTNTAVPCRGRGRGVKQSVWIFSCLVSVRRHFVRRRVGVGRGRGGLLVVWAIGTGQGAAGGETKLIHCKSWPAFKLGNGVGRIFCSIHLSSPLAINNIHKYFRGITKMHILDFKCI